ncbi:MAG: 50S ribosomal protein L35, partial [Synergistaceae bacterium]|nr:50S ribosomal protein L35 [Synergistaceae bacterium]
MAKQKLKSHSGAKKRFFKTASGKFAYRKCSRSHILVHKK